MSTIQSRRLAAKKRAAVFGVLSVGLYAAVFAFSQPFLQLCAKGGLYNVITVSTVFLFSYIHGSFASNVWTALGIEASSSATKKATKQTRPTAQPAARKRAQVAN